MGERLSREIWAKRVERWKDSGLTSKEFAAELGINPRTLTFWKWNLTHETKAKAPALVPETSVATEAEQAVEFVEVKPRRPNTPPAEPFELVVDGLVIRIPSSFEVESLRRLLDAVRS